MNIVRQLFGGSSKVTSLLPMKRLFTPGPLTTTPSVREALLCDYGSRDGTFLDIVKSVRKGLVGLANETSSSDIQDSYDAVLMQGAGTFSVESVIGSTTPRDGHLLVLINGVYGHRIASIANTLNIKTSTIVLPENDHFDTHNIVEVSKHLEANPDISNVAVVHCETTTGIMNNIDILGDVVKAHGATYFVDAMSSFAGCEFDLATNKADFIVSSANKCIQGVPGFGFVLFKPSELEKCTGFARSVSLSLLDQWKGLEKTGQFRFTPPTHTIAAFKQAMDELRLEGGVKGRIDRYTSNHLLLLEGMEKLGFRAYLPKSTMGHIITSFHYPDHPNFDFEQFYTKLEEQGFVIYPGKLTQATTFRMGNIGDLYGEDMADILRAIKKVAVEMGVPLPVPAPKL